jgi:sulfotransferase
MPNIHFIAGLPRAGSTLLCNVLAQNPSFLATATSGILEVLVAVRNDWGKIASFAASPNPAGKELVLKGILNSYYSGATQQHVFDKSRGWLAYLPLAEMIIGRKAKVLVPVRDIRDVISSFELIARKYASTEALPQEKANPAGWGTLEGRVQMWADAGSPVGSAFNRLKDAIQRGYRDRLHFVRFEELTRDPATTMAGIYDFLEIPHYVHDFNNVQQVTVEDDVDYGFPADSLHKIRPTIAPMKPHWPEVLGKALGDQIASYNQLWSK